VKQNISFKKKFLKKKKPKLTIAFEFQWDDEILVEHKEKRKLDLLI
jgi:hypothetical protein